jgi:lipoic acid synthetase
LSDGATTSDAERDPAGEPAPQRSPNAKPPWLKVRLPGSERYHEIKGRSRQLKLATVCEEARCPNIGECWGGGTATFMVMGDTCTRGCRFCAVKTARRPAPLDPDEPVNVATAIAELDLDYVVITSVDRDDQPDGGARHFAACIRETRARAPKTKIEVLIPDFRGDVGHLRAVVDAGPEVIAQNLETVERLTHPVRDRKASYAVTLEVLRNVKRLNPAILTKSSLMVGLGETEDEMLAAMRDLRAAGVDFLTIGQYLQPTKKHLDVVSFVHPDQFAAYERQGLELGFAYVASGPLVRSSYKAGEFFISRYLDAQRA